MNEDFVRHIIFTSGQAAGKEKNGSRSEHAGGYGIVRIKTDWAFHGYLFGEPLGEPNNAKKVK
jgi:hypothetical protein